MPPTRLLIPEDALTAPAATQPLPYGRWLRGLDVPYPSGSPRAHHDVFWLSRYARQLCESGWLDSAWRSPDELAAVLLAHRSEAHIPAHKVYRMLNAAAQTYSRYRLTVIVANDHHRIENDVGLATKMPPGGTHR